MTSPAPSPPMGDSWYRDRAAEMQSKSKNKVPVKVIRDGLGLDILAFEEALRDLRTYVEQNCDNSAWDMATGVKLKTFKIRCLDAWFSSSTRWPVFHSPSIPDNFKMFAKTCMWETMCSKRNIEKKGTRTAKKDPENDEEMPDAPPSDSADQQPHASARRSSSVGSLGTSRLRAITIVDKAEPFEIRNASFTVFDGNKAGPVTKFSLLSCLHEKFAPLKYDPSTSVAQHMLSYDAFRGMVRKKCGAAIGSIDDRVVCSIHDSIPIDDDDSLATLVGEAIVRAQGSIISLVLSAAQDLDRPAKKVDFDPMLNNPEHTQVTDPEQTQVTQATGSGSGYADQSEGPCALTRPHTTTPAAASPHSPAEGQSHKRKRRRQRTPRLPSNSSKSDYHPSDSSSDYPAPHSKRPRTTDNAVILLSPAEHQQPKEPAPANQDASDHGIGEEESPYPNPDDDDGEIEKDLGALDKEKFAKLSEKRIMAVVKRKCERMIDTDWMAAAGFWGVPADQIKGTNLITLPSDWALKTTGIAGHGFFPYQLVQAYQLYMSEKSDNNATIFGNMMGMGKTAVLLMLILIGHRHLLLHLEIEEDQKNGISTRHNITTGPGETGPCPTSRERSFRCPCDSSSELFGFPPRLAPTVAASQKQPIEAWCAQYLDLLHNTKWTKPGMTPYPLRFCWYGSRVNLKMRSEDDPYPEPTPDEVLEMQRAVSEEDTAKVLREINVAYHVKTPGTRNQTHTVDREFEVDDGSIATAHMNATDLMPPKSSARFILVAAHAYVDRRLSPSVRYRTGTASGVETFYDYKKKALMEEERQRRFQIPVFTTGRTIYDEFHNCKSADTLFYEYYNWTRKNNKGYQWKSIAVSGTPFETGLHEALIFLHSAATGVDNSKGASNWMETNSNGKPVRWDDDLSKVYKTDIYDTIATQGDKQSRKWKTFADKSKSLDTMAADKRVKYNQELAELEREGTVVVEKFVLRCTWSTRNPWNQPISGIEGVFDTAYRPCPSPEFVPTINDATQRIEAALEKELNRDIKSHEVQSMHHEMLYATCPGFATLRADTMERKGLRAWEQLWARFAGHAISNPTHPDSPYMIHKDAILRGSAKYTSIVAYCKEVQGKTRRYQNPSSPSARYQQKVLIGGYKPVALASIAVGLIAEFGRDQVVHLPATLSIEEQDRRVKRWRDASGAFILLASLTAFAESITLVEANHVLITEPQTRTAKQDQFLFRVYRLGQMENISNGLVLYNPKSRWELRLLKKQCFKRKTRDNLEAAEKGGGVVEADASVFETDAAWQATEDLPMVVDGL